MYGILGKYKKKFSNIKDDFVSYYRYGNQRFVLDNRIEGSQDYLSLACIIKNEGRYIREFIEFHMLAGVDRFYIFDNESTDDTREMLKEYIDCGRVVYIFYPGARMQFSAYRNAVKLSKSRTKWLALIDADEFLFSPKGSLKDILKNFESYPAVGVNWVCFGPSGHEKRPKGLVIENYTQTFADKNHLFNRHIKSIVQPKEVESISSPHYCVYKGGRYAVDENFNLIDGNTQNTPYRACAFTSVNSVEKLRINHYITKSVEDLREKRMRGYPDGMPPNNVDESLERFKVDLIEDKVIAGFVEELKKRLFH